MSRKIVLPNLPQDTLSVESPDIDYRLIVAYRRGQFPKFQTMVYCGIEEWVWLMPDFSGHADRPSEYYEHSSDSTGREGIREILEWETKLNPDEWKIVQYDNLVEKYEAMLKFIKDNKLKLS